MAIRADERVVIIFDLPAECVPDPDYIDTIAVERALAGDRVVLTPAERAVVAAAIATGRRRWRLADALGLSGTAVATLAGRVRSCRAATDLDVALVGAR